MPTKDEHIEKATRNESFAETLFKATYLDWAVTVLFYTALHYVDAVLAVSRADPEDHKERQQLIQRNDTLRRVYPEYRMLEALSRSARYFAVDIDEGDLQRARIEFSVLREHIRRRLGLS